jgi:hypothetical protein
MWVRQFLIRPAALAISELPAAFENLGAFLRGDAEAAPLSMDMCPADVGPHVALAHDAQAQRM